MIDNVLRSRVQSCVPWQLTLGVVQIVLHGEVPVAGVPRLVAEDAHQRHPNDRQVLLTLVTIHRDHGDRKAALRYAEKLVLLSPQDQAARQLLERLQSGHVR